MSRNLETPTKLTEFAPLQNEEKPQSVSYFFSRFFKLGKSPSDDEQSNAVAHNDNNSEDLPAWVDESENTDNETPYTVDVLEGRSLPNVLKRISNLLALKTNNLQDYGDTELKQYWMPDSVSRECYECSEKFTTFRRRHHCRVCGQIFCSTCCNQQIPGKMFGCTGDLRVCTYCCKVVLSYLSSDVSADLTGDLKLLQESLRSKLATSPMSSSSSLQESLNQNQKGEAFDGPKLDRRYQEEMFASGELSSMLTNEEKCKALQNSYSLRSLYEELSKPFSGISRVNQRYRLRNHMNSFLGSELVDWLICQQKASNRIQAIAIAQALVDADYIECLSEAASFIDGNALYKFGDVINAQAPAPITIHDIPAQDEPMWVQQILQETSNTDSDNELLSPLNRPFLKSSSSYMLDLNVEASTVYLSRPPSVIVTDSRIENYNFEDKPEIRTFEQRELVPESGWHNAMSLRDENEEKISYETLTIAYEEHQQSLLKQLLGSECISMLWANIIPPLVQHIINVVRPDKNHDARDLDIRNYVRIKKLPSGLRNETKVIDGIVCTKNIAHKGMSSAISNPKILLLQGAIVYQRTEGRLMSLEPVLMQEHEYLGHVCARIVALQPDLVMVQRNVSRLAQDILREKGITLVHNVKQGVLDRLSVCTGADFIASLDAHIGRPRLGTCKRFQVETFDIGGVTKTLMFFEGLPVPHLGSSILLRGSKNELAKVKTIVSSVLFASYNWRLEKSFLMDEFARPSKTCEFFDDSRENSTTSVLIIKKDEGKKLKEKVDDRSLMVERVNDFSDPLHSSYEPDESVMLEVFDLPFSNVFRKALDDTILCVSPFIIFPIPYLETEVGKKCKLRKFFPREIYYSKHFEMNRKSAKGKEQEVEESIGRMTEETLKPVHDFTLQKFTSAIENIDVQNNLAHFRAKGGRYMKQNVIPQIKRTDDSSAGYPDAKMDVLDPANHQRLAVLFCSFSDESQNAPAFCMNPGVVYMDFYGRNDIPLGCFLKKYCFRSTYNCPSSSCTTPMVKHVRRFVHNLGCVSVFLKSFESDFSEENIVMWSSCLKCQNVSPVVAMSTDTWSFSFAKYLELKFHGSRYGRRGNPPCEHSLHQDHIQYFGYKNDVASFRYSPINIWEISLPPPLIRIQVDNEHLHRCLIDEIKELAQKGHDIFSFISERMTALGNTEEVTINLSKDRAIFKQKIEEIQLKLTSPTIEGKDFNNTEIAETYWKLSDKTISIKHFLELTIESWNAKLQENEKKRDYEKRKDKHALSESENVNGDIVTENENPELLDSPQILLTNDESNENKRDNDKKSVKTLLSQLLPSSGPTTSIPNPFPFQDHHGLPAGVYASLMVSENDLSSIIAYALNSSDLKRAMEGTKQIINIDPTASPASRRKLLGDKEKTEVPDEKNTLLSFLRNRDSKTDLTLSISPQPDHDQPPELFEDNKKLHLDVVFEDSGCNFLCRIYYAEKFAALRALVMPDGEEIFVRSLTKSVPWNARGGKSGSVFTKTVDDRFILKETSKNEVHLFLESAMNYFAYMQKCYATDQPTLLGKIVGIYQIIFKNNINGQQLRKNLLVMENLFYNRSVLQKFDLKGSVRNRLVIPDNQEGEIVLLDENLLKMTCKSPLYILPHSKAVLTAAIENDTEFLSSQAVMDYSLLVGLDNQSKELVLGIIDYIRTFTWDKKLETIVKKSGILGGQGKQPTIISPIEYQKRFIEAMHKYFLEVPDHWEGLGKDLES